MTSKAEFNAEEWSTVVDGPLYAGLRVITADRGGAIRETLAMSRVYQEARAKHGENELLDELVKSPPSIDAGRAREVQGNIGKITSQQLREAIRILETFVMTVAQAVAGAHKEGGFLGVGGKQVSEAENQALDEISTALGSPPAA